MRWTFSDPQSIFPTLEADETPIEQTIVATPFDGCAWCGDGEGICAACMASMAVQSAALAARGDHRYDPNR